MDQLKHGDRQRRKILDTSQKLFLRDGYSKTTIRKIVAETGLTTGTLYHFFRNKEDILVTLMNEGFHDTVRAVNAMAGKSGDPVLSYALDIAAVVLPLYASREIVGLYSVFFTAPESSTRLIEGSVGRLRSWFGETHPDMTRGDYYFRALAMTGFIQSCLKERIHGDFKPGYRELYIFLAEMHMALFNIEPHRIQAAIRKALDLLGRGGIEMFGHRFDGILKKD
jgi:AcrR family transcriptional regulator